MLCAKCKRTNRTHLFSNPTYTQTTTSYDVLQNFYKRILYSWWGWTTNVTLPIPDKCIICVAPHTSNYDFLLGELYIRSVGRAANFLMKKEWFFWPMGSLMRALGGIPVERSRKTSLTDQLAAKAKEASTICLAVTPEGTRSRVDHWKRGFYYIALKAQIPILLYGIDYKKKEIVCTRQLFPSGNVEEDMKSIMDYYRGFSARHPEKFALEDIDV